MLVLHRRRKQGIVIETADGPITIIVLKCSANGNVRFGIEAPAACRVLRSELLKTETVPETAAHGNA